MVLYKNKCHVTNSKYPDSDFMGNADWVVPDGSELAEKIKGLSDFAFVFDDNGNLVDVKETEPQPIPEKPPEPPTNAELAAAIAELAEAICGG